MIVLVLLGFVWWQNHSDVVAISKDVRGFESGRSIARGRRPRGSNFGRASCQLANGREVHDEISSNQSKMLFDLKTKAKEHDEIAINHVKMLRDIATTADGGKTYMPNIYGNSQANPKFRQESEKAVAYSISRPEGELWVYNATQSEQRLRVNGESRPYTVPVNRGLVFTVPSGTATTEIPGDGTKSWFIGRRITAKF